MSLLRNSGFPTRPTSSWSARVEPSLATSRRYLIIGAKFSISFGLLWLLFSRIDIGRLWALAGQASLVWIITAVGAYCVSVLVSIWRWRTLLQIQDVRVSRSALCASFLTALFFNNFLPSNVGGDVIRIRDTAPPAGSNTIAATIVLADRVIGLLGLILFAAFGATISTTVRGSGSMPLSPSWIWGGFAASTMALALVLVAPTGIRRILNTLARGRVGDQIETLTRTLGNFRASPGGLAGCFAAAVLVQVSNLFFYVAVAYALHVNISPWALAVIVPVSSLAQALPVSINGFGVREATFSVLFARVGLAMESALVVSLVATTLIMIFSLAGAVVYVVRQRQLTTSRTPEQLVQI